MTNTADPRKILDEAPMTALQIAVVAITVFLNALDGFDVLAISFASPGIAGEWGIESDALGFVLSAELVGMAVGSIFLGGVGDKIGRRHTLLGCLVVMAAGMYLVTTTNSIYELAFWRVITGLGIGGLLACTNATTAEFSSLKRRHLCISLMVIGYPLGGVFGGMVASSLLASFDWRSVFYFGSIVTALLIPVVFFLVPESVHWLCRKQPAGALDKINATLSRMGHQIVSALPDLSTENHSKGPANIFAPAMIAITILVTAAYFMHITTFYFILKWTPKIVSDMGFAASSAGGVLVWANVGGALGGAIFGLLTARVPLKKLTIVILILTMGGVTMFGRTGADLDELSLLAAFAGFFGNAGITGFYAILAQVFPTHMRATGTGFAIGVGRGGAVLSPILAGFLLQWEYGLPTVALVMGLGSLISAMLLIFLKLGTDRPAEAGGSTERGPVEKAAAATA